MPPIKVLQSQFLCAASKLEHCPPMHLPEVVFLGRSNVGKSTLINKVLQQKIAKSSATPGKTQTANFFDTRWQLTHQVLKFHCIDLPGFGYAKVSKSLQQEWGVFLCNLLKTRSSIKLFLHLVDARHPNLALDQEVACFLDQLIAPTQQVRRIYTKFDKLNANQQHALWHKTPNCLATCLKTTDISAKFGSLDAIQMAIIEGLFGIKTDENT
ncbi:ribosome biogenesis GTP-binding protein YihA/YsxC [Helicobacter mehlei]|uniref:Probable GTP-binding protein EngB n=1 Tax=Helicobacter mehlei TaxID=2316080 RepID=A0A553V3N6_9HELI|nr:ribosome biogenesis GTP-binding protein YihA/YsxC [Helicobacter mehlei]TSA86994.1 YihA family ribosome biogenesis GTP-binding protein [Helicobacter mehlei]